MKMIAPIALWLALASQANALSCVYPNIAERFNALNSAPENYVMVEGQLTPPTSLPDPQPEETVQAIYRFDGVLIGNNQDLPVSTQVAVRAECLSVWCGGFPREALQVVTFLGFAAGGYTLDIGPCPGEMMADPTEADMDVLRQCLQQGACSATDIAHFAPDG